MAENNKQLEEAKKLLQEINTLRARLNQTPLKMTDSDAVQNIQSLRNELKGVQKSFEDVDSSATSLYDQVRAISSEFKNQPGALQKIRGSMKKITSIAEDLKMQEQGIKDLSTKQLDDLTQRLKENKKILDDESQRLLNGEDLSDIAQKEVQALQDLIKEQGGLNSMTREQVDAALELVNVMDNLTAEQKAALANYVDQGNAIGDIEAKINAVKEQQKEVNKLMGVGGAVIDGMDGLMGKLGMNSNVFKDAVGEAKDKMKAAAEEIQSGAKAGGRLSVLMAGLGPLASGFASALFDPLTIMLKILDAFFKVDQAGAKFQQQTGMNADALAGANSELATSVDFLETASELSSQIGTNAVVALGPDLVAAAAGLKNELGLSAENAGMLAVNAKLSGMSMKGLEDQVQAATDEFNNTTDSAVSSTQVIRDMGKASKAVQAQFSQFPGGLAKAAAAARKIGMELKDMDGIMDGLLNFEDSIAAEMEAELLTGKELNLNRARELALANDIEGVSKELFKNSVDVSEYAKMNRFEQESYAKALGMSRDQLGEMAIQRGILSGMTDEEKAKIRGVTLEESKRMDIQAELQKSLDKLAQALTPMLEILVPIAEVLGNIIRMIATPIGYLMKWADALKGIGGTFGEILSMVTKLAIGGGILLIAKSLKDAFNPDVAGGFFENLKKNFGGIGKMAGGLKDKLLGKGKDKAADVASKATDKLTEKAADQTGDLASKTKDAQGDGPGGFLKGLGDGLASIGKQFQDVVKGALALGIAGLALGGSFALALKMVEGVDPVTMLAFAGSIGIFGASLALVGKLGNDAIKGALAMGIAGVALIPAAYAFSLMAGVDPMSVVALSGSLIALGIAAALMGNLGGQIIMGALALGILAVALIPAAYAFSLLGSVDPMAVIAMTGSLIALGAAAAIMGMTGPMVLAGAAAIGVLALAMIPAAYAFSLLGSVDPMAITAMVASLVVLGGAAALIGMTGPMVLAGAAAIGILALAMIPAAFAFSLLKGVDPASVLAFAVALPILALATAGLGLAAPFIMAGAAALVVLGVALIPLSVGISALAGADIEGVVSKLSLLAQMGPGLMMAGVGLIAAAGGLAVFAAALAGGSLASGLTSLFTGGGIMEDLQNLAAMAGPLQSVAGSLTAIAAALGGIGAALATMDTEKLDEMQGLIMTTAFAAPAIAAAGAIGDMISGIAGGGEESGKSESNEKLIAKIDELIVAVKQGKNINMDGRKVGGTLAVAATNT